MYWHLTPEAPPTFKSGPELAAVRLGIRSAGVVQESFVWQEQKYE